MSAPALHFRAAGRVFGARSAIDHLNLEIPPGEFAALVGPSGCGKTTILNLAAGLLAPTSGAVESFGGALTGLNPHVSYLFQQDTLLPWKTLEDNIALAATFSGRAGRDEAREWLTRLGLEGFGDYYPAQASGGMRKRVALAQQWLPRRPLLLMDEPFSALDIHTRQRMETELLNLWDSDQRTVLFVTHDLEEAIALASVVYVLSAGPGSRIVNRYPIHLPRPRAIAELRLDPRFTDLYRAIWDDLRPEVQRAHAR
ncbi:MAG: ABC transporter ATP-binding protein [Bryobacteraceae bacterium]|nr:ABC transporter ATP-binding protein [Bryobacteraceae bacterium]